jgi:hypothetical protein
LNTKVSRDAVETEEPENRNPPGRRGPWPLILLVIVATAVGIYLIPGQKQADRSGSGPGRTGEPQRPSLLEAPPAGQSPAAPADAGLPEPVAREASAPATPTGPAAPGAAARALIADLRASPRPDIERAFAAARAFRTKGEKADAYLMYFYAAREGNAEAALAFARQADPAFHDADSVFERPRVDQAYKWYLQALNAGNTAAAGPLEALKARLEAAAAGGDDQARRLTLRWR